MLVNNTILLFASYLYLLYIPGMSNSEISNLFFLSIKVINKSIAAARETELPVFDIFKHCVYQSILEGVFNLYQSVIITFKSKA